MLRTDPDLEVVGEAIDGIQALQLVETLKPDLVLLDITMPPDDGIETAKRLKERHPELVMLFLTMHEDEGLLHAALQAGAAGYVIKRADVAEILQAIRAASRGEIYVHPAMTRALLERPATTAHRRSLQAEQLTPREVDVLRLLVRGNTNRQVAELLGISVRTIENHRANLMGKLGLESRVDLVDYAEEHRLA